MTRMLLLVGGLLFVTALTFGVLVDSEGLKAENLTPTPPNTAIETVCEHYQRGNSGSEHWTTTDVCTARNVAAGYTGPR